MVTDDFLQSGDAIGANHEPQLQRPEAASQLHRDLRVILNAVSILRDQIGRRDRHGFLQIIDRFHEMRRTVEIGHQPLMRVHHHRIRHLDPLGDAPEFRADQRGPGPCRVDMGEQTLLPRKRKHFIKAVAIAHSGAADDGDKGAGQVPRRSVFGYGGAQRVGPHRAGLVSLDLDQVLAPDPRQEHGLLDR